MIEKGRSTVRASMSSACEREVGSGAAASETQRQMRVAVNFSVVRSFACSRRLNCSGRAVDQRLVQREHEASALHGRPDLLHVHPAKYG